MVLIFTFFYTRYTLPWRQAMQEKAGHTDKKKGRHLSPPISLLNVGKERSATLSTRAREFAEAFRAPSQGRIARIVLYFFPSISFELTFNYSVRVGPSPPSPPPPLENDTCNLARDTSAAVPTMCRFISGGGGIRRGCGGIRSVIILKTWPGWVMGSWVYLICLNFGPRWMSFFNCAMCSVHKLNDPRNNLTLRLKDFIDFF